MSQPVGCTKISLMQPKTIILLGFVLVFLGFLLPLLMVIRVLEPSFLLSFISYAASVSGLILGFVGSVMITRLRKGR